MDWNTVLVWAVNFLIKKIIVSDLISYVYISNDTWIMWKP